jgi:hypothetical protein
MHKQTFLVYIISWLMPWLYSYVICFFRWSYCLSLGNKTEDPSWLHQSPLSHCQRMQVLCSRCRCFLLGALWSWQVCYYDIMDRTLYNLGHCKERVLRMRDNDKWATLVMFVITQHSYITARFLFMNIQKIWICITEISQMYKSRDVIIIHANSRTVGFSGHPRK